MDDSEARYLIDQFNKYAAWNAGYWVTIYPFLAVLLAIGALYFSALFQVGPASLRTYPYDLMIISVFLGLSVFLMVVALIIRRNYHKETFAFSERLVMLEGYRSIFKSVPDTVTFWKIINFKQFKTEDLKNELDKSAQEMALSRKVIIPTKKIKKPKKR